MPMWKFRGQQRPDFAIEPAPDQESVWDYPRPPALVGDERRVKILSPAGEILVDTDRSWRVLETASPPTFYVGRDDVRVESLAPAPGRSFCEWKGEATYWALAGQPRGQAVAWSYETPSRRFSDLKGALGFYPDRVQCFVGGERVRAQLGGFYGGWVTDEIVGPYKGEPGTGGW